MFILGWILFYYTLLFSNIVFEDILIFPFLCLFVASINNGRHKIKGKICCHLPQVLICGFWAIYSSSSYTLQNIWNRTIAKNRIQGYGRHIWIGMSGYSNWFQTLGRRTYSGGILKQYSWIQITRQDRNGTTGKWKSHTSTKMSFSTKYVGEVVPFLPTSNPFESQKVEIILVCFTELTWKIHELRKQKAN